MTGTGHHPAAVCRDDQGTPREIDRNPYTVRELREIIRQDHGLPRRRAEYLARKCYRDADTAREYLPPSYVDTMHPPAVSYVRRIRRPDPTGARATNRAARAA